MTLRSSTDSTAFRSAGAIVFGSQTKNTLFRSANPPETRFKVENLFAFHRGRGDLLFSLLMLALVGFLLWHFNTESGWDSRKLPQKRVGKILKQGWIGPFLCMLILVPAVLLNLWQSIRKYRLDRRRLVPLRIRYEVGQWLRSLEFILYFMIYTYAISWLGYLLSTLIFAVCLTWRLGYRSRRWVLTSLASAFAIVLLFRTILQIKTPINIWLYNQLPAGWENFMKVYF